uniref:Uncharacterized protein n=1 Tax=Oryza brachyantha TaxID=4533 RepID=J3LP80_ORYBR
MRREPRRGLGVAELERIRVQLEAAQSLFMIPPSLSSSSSALATPPPPSYPPPGAVRYGQQQQYVVHPSITHAYMREKLTLADVHTQVGNGSASSSSSKALFPLQINQGVDRSAVNAPPIPRQQQGSSEELYKLQLQLQECHRRRVQQQQQLLHGEGTATAARRTQSIPFVNLVDSDDDEAAAGAGEELDLELRL